MQQTQHFPVVTVSQPEQEQMARDLAVIVNILKFNVIEVEQLDPRARELQGIIVCKYNEIKEADEALLVERMPHLQNQSRYRFRLIGGSLTFVMNPYVSRMAVGTGRVCFLVDDNLPVPPMSLSGATHGWNREFLATHYEAGFWQIIDSEMQQDIYNRHLRIQAAIKARREAIERGEEPPAPPNVEPAENLPVAGGELPAISDPGLAVAEGEEETAMSGEVESTPPRAPVQEPGAPPVPVEPQEPQVPVASNVDSDAIAGQFRQMQEELSLLRGDFTEVKQNNAELKEANARLEAELEAAKKPRGSKGNGRAGRKTTAKAKAKAGRKKGSGKKKGRKKSTVSGGFAE